MARKPTDEVQLKLRFSEALRRRLERAAARNNRSMNTEIIHRLGQSFERAELPAAKAGRSVSEEIEYRLDRSFYEDVLPKRMAETIKPAVKEAVETAERNIATDIAIKMTFGITIKTLEELGHTIPPADYERVLAVVWERVPAWLPEKRDF
jgi:Arc-like DNA binding domain